MLAEGARLVGAPQVGEREEAREGGRVGDVQRLHGRLVQAVHARDAEAHHIALLQAQTERLSEGGCRRRRS